MTKQKNVELAELPDFLGPPEKASRVVVTPDILGSKMTDVPDFLGPPEKFDSAPRSRSQSIEVTRVFLVAMIQYWLQVAEEVASSLVVTMRLETDSDRRVSISCAPPTFKVILHQKKKRAEDQTIRKGGEMIDITTIRIQNVMSLILSAIGAKSERATRPIADRCSSFLPLS